MLITPRTALPTSWLQGHAAASLPPVWLSRQSSHLVTGKSHRPQSRWATTGSVSGSSWVPAAPRTGRSRQYDGGRVKPLWPIRVMAMPVSWDITVERAADSSLQLQPLGRLAFW